MVRATTLVIRFTVSCFVLDSFQIVLPGFVKYQHRERHQVGNGGKEDTVLVFDLFRMSRRG